MSRNIFKNFTVLIAILFSFGACTKKQETSETSTPKVLNVAIWANYIPEENLKKFTDSTGIKLNISNYSSNEELLAKIQAGGAGYDIIFPSDYMIDIMSKLNLLQPLDKSKIPNFQNVESKFLGKSFDPENTYSVPYNFSTTGIAINTDLVKGKVSAWRDVLNSKPLAGKVSLLDDVRETMAVALKMNASSINTKNLGELKKAKETLLEVKKNLKMFRSDTIDPLVNKEIAVAHAYSSDALQAAAKSNGKIEYIIPSDGATAAIDNMAVLKDAKNTEAAYALINFLSSQEANKLFVEKKFGTPVIKGVKESLSPELQNMTGLFPSEETLKKTEMIQDLGEETAVYDKIWTEVKSN